MTWLLLITVVVILVMIAAAIWFNIGAVVEHLLGVAWKALKPRLLARKPEELEKRDRQDKREGVERTITGKERMH